MKKTITLLLAFGMASYTANAVVVLGTVIGVDFESPNALVGDSSPQNTPTQSWNTFGQDLADGATGTLAAPLVDLGGASLAGVGLSVTNNLGKGASQTGVVSNTTTVAPFDDSAIFEDNWGGASVGNGGRADFGPLTAASNVVITFTGLDTNFLYDLSGGGAFNNDNFNTTWTSGGVTATTDSDSATGGEFITLSDLAPNASGDLSVTVSRPNVQLLFSAVTLEAVSVVPEPSTSLLAGLAGLGLLVRRRR